MGGGVAAEFAMRYGAGHNYGRPQSTAVVLEFLADLDRRRTFAARR
jgi:hypothetical protein